VYDVYQEVFVVMPLKIAAEIQTVLDASTSATAKSFKPEDFFDDSIIQKIQARGSSSR